MTIKPYPFKIKIEDNLYIKYFDYDTEIECANFIHPLTSSQYKIYVIVSENKVLYIGTTSQSIKTRLNIGIKNKYSYKWKDVKSDLFLFVFCFPEFDQDKIENIEAELAFLVRHKTGSWPTKQNEIHFNNEFKEGVEIAKKIYKELNLKQ
jgi:hypothetical protein